MPRGRKQYSLLNAEGVEMYRLTGTHIEAGSGTAKLFDEEYNDFNGTTPVLKAIIFSDGSSVSETEIVKSETDPTL